jgi:magnesium transporter
VDVLTAIDEPRLRELVAADDFFWLDLMSPSDADLDLLHDVFDIHPAAIEDSREWRQLPKVDDYEDRLLLVFFSAGHQDSAAVPIEVHVHLSGTWVVTIRRCATPLDAVHDRLREEGTDDEDMIVYRLLDALADGWDPVIDDLDARVDEVEEQVLQRPRQEQLTAIYRLKQEIANLQRHATRLNRLVTFVTIGSIFFVVWTLVTGFFGQNFGFLVRHIDSQRAFFAYELGALVVPTVVIAGILFWRRRDWL